MRRAILSIIAITAMLIPASSATARSRAKKCPVKMPETLLSLYRQSDAIYIARYDKKEYGDVSRSTEDYSVVDVKTNFDIASVLKGEARKFVVLSDEEYQYKLQPEDENKPQRQAAFIEDYESYDPLAEPKPGDAVLLFLKKDEEGNGLSLTDYRDAIKKLTSDQLAVYIDRIKELNSIFSAEKTDPAAIVEWLIRCAENPATRWEGTFELLSAFQRLDWQESRAEEQRQKAARGEVINDEDKIEAESSIYETAAYARALTDYQKASLSQILLNRNYQEARTNRENKGGLIRGDRELIELVKRWGGESVALFLLDQLRSGAFAAADNSRMMETVAEMIEDSQASSIAEKYGEITQQEDDAAVVDEEGAESADIAEVDTEVLSVEAGTADVAEEAEPAVEGETTPSVAKEGTPGKQTYKELREELLAKFIARGEKVLSKQ